MENLRLATHVATRKRARARAGVLGGIALKRTGTCAKELGHALPAANLKPFTNSGPIPQRRSEMEQQSDMTDREHQNRIEALANAVRHRLKEEKASDIVDSAEKYFAFLEGE